MLPHIRYVQMSQAQERIMIHSGESEQGITEISSVTGSRITNIRIKRTKIHLSLQPAVVGLLTSDERSMPDLINKISELQMLN